MRIGNDEIDRTQVLTTCSWFLMNKIENGMEKHGKQNSLINDNFSGHI